MSLCLTRKTHWLPTHRQPLTLTWWLHRPLNPSSNQSQLQHLTLNSSRLYLMLQRRRLSDERLDNPLNLNAMVSWHPCPLNLITQPTLRPWHLLTRRHGWRQCKTSLIHWIDIADEVWWFFFIPRMTGLIHLTNLVVRRGILSQTALGGKSWQRILHLSYRVVETLFVDYILNFLDFEDPYSKLPGRLSERCFRVLAVVKGLWCWLHRTLRVIAAFETQLLRNQHEYGGKNLILHIKMLNTSSHSCSWTTTTTTNVQAPHSKPSRAWDCPSLRYSYAATTVKHPQVYI